MSKIWTPNHFSPNFKLIGSFLKALVNWTCPFDRRRLLVKFFLALQSIVGGKMLALGQLELFVKSDFNSFWNSLLTVPTTIELEKETGFISKELIGHAPHSNELRYLHESLVELFSLPIAGRFVFWPTVLYILTATFLLKILFLSLLTKLKIKHVRRKDLLRKQSVPSKDQHLYKLQKIVQSK